MHSVRNTVSSPLSMAGKGWRHGSYVGALATPILGPYATLAGGTVGVSAYSVFATMFGEEAAGKSQEYIRDTLGLDTDQEISAGGETAIGESRGLI